MTTSAEDRTLILLRHGKSAYPDKVKDHDRPLAPRGVRQAGLAGKAIRRFGHEVDLVLCSTAERAQATLQSQFRPGRVSPLSGTPG